MYRGDVKVQKRQGLISRAASHFYRRSIPLQKRNSESVNPIKALTFCFFLFFFYSNRRSKDKSLVDDADEFNWRTDMAFKYDLTCECVFLFEEWQKRLNYFNRYERAIYKKHKTWFIKKYRLTYLSGLLRNRIIFSRKWQK